MLRSFISFLVIGISQQNYGFSPRGNVTAGNRPTVLRHHEVSRGKIDNDVTLPSVKPLEVLMILLVLILRIIRVRNPLRTCLILLTPNPVFSK